MENASVCGQKSLADCESLGKNADVIGFQRCWQWDYCWHPGGGGETLGKVRVGLSIWSWGLGRGLSHDSLGAEAIKRKRMLSKALVVEPRGFGADRLVFIS